MERVYLEDLIVDTRLILDSLSYKQGARIWAALRRFRLAPESGIMQKKRSKQVYDRRHGEDSFLRSWQLLS
jgi:hypothetical protein